MADLILEKLDEQRRVATEAFANSDEERTVRKFILDLLKELDEKEVPYEGGGREISDKPEERTLLETIIKGIDIRTDTKVSFLEAYMGTLSQGQYWNESIHNLASLFHSLISNTYIPQEADDKTIDYSKVTGDIPSHFVKYYNGVPYNISFDSSDVKNADAGANFVDEDQVITLRNGKNYVTNLWVRPWSNIDGETYRTVRGEDKIESVLNNPKNLQFTRQGYQNESESYWPDLNNNDILDTGDASNLLEYLASGLFEDDPLDETEMTEEQKKEYLKKADADRNGHINVDDASLILSFVSGSGAGYYQNNKEDWEEFLKDQGIFSLNKTELNKYLRLIMPMYLRNVEIEDLNRNFWVIGQTCAAIATFLFDPNGPINSLLKGILDELAQLWDNVFMLNIGVNEQYYEKQHGYFRYCEVIPVNQTSWSKFNKYDNFDFDTTVEKIRNSIREAFKEEASENSYEYKPLDGADENIKKLFNYVSYQLKVYDSPSFLFIIPELRVNNYKRNYYSEIYIPCFFRYQADENVGGWTYSIIDFTAKIGENKQIENGEESDTGKLVISTTRNFSHRSKDEENESKEFKKTYDIYGIREKNNELYLYVTNLSEYTKTLSVNQDEYTGLIGIHYNFSPKDPSTVTEAQLSFEITFYDVAKFVANSSNYILQTVNQQQKPNSMKQDFVIDKKYYSSTLKLNDGRGGATWYDFQEQDMNIPEKSETLSVNETPIIKGYYQGDLISSDLTPQPLDVDIGVKEIWTVPCVYSKDESHRNINLFTQLNGSQTFNPSTIYNDSNLDFDINMLSFSGDNTADDQNKYFQTKYNDFNGKTCSEITKKVLQYESEKVCNEIKEKSGKEKLAIALVTAQHVNTFQDTDGRNNGVISFYKPDEEKGVNIEFKVENSPYSNFNAFSGGAYINLDDGSIDEEEKEKGMYYEDYRVHPAPDMIGYVYQWYMYNLAFSTDGSQKAEFQTYCESTAERDFETYQKEHNTNIYNLWNGGTGHTYFEIMTKTNGDDTLHLTGENKNWLITRIERGVQDTNTWTIGVNDKQERTYLEKYCYGFGSGKVWQQAYSERNSLLTPETFQRQKDLFDQIDSEQKDTVKFGEHVENSIDIIKKRYKDFGNEEDYKNLTINNLSVKENGVEAKYWQKNPYVLIRDLQDNNVTITEDEQDIKKRIEEAYYNSGFNLQKELLNNTSIKTLEDYKKAHKDWPWCEVDTPEERKEKLRRIYAGDHSKKFLVGNIATYVRIDVFTNDGKTAQRFYYRDLQSIIDYYKNGEQIGEGKKSPWQNQWKCVDYKAKGQNGEELDIDKLREGYKMYNRVDTSGRKITDDVNYEKYKSGATEDFYDDGDFPSEYDKRKYFDKTGGED